MIDDGLHVSA